MTRAGVIEGKAALRRQLAQLPVPDWTPLTDAFLALPEVAEARTVMLFWGVGREPETGKIAETLLQRGKLVVLPRCLPEYRLEGRGIRDRSDLKPGKYGIPEPGEECPVIERDTIDLILVPNLCCDKQGYRLGHGAGYYDRYLVGYRGITVSLCPDGWLQEQVPRDEFDVPVQVVLTETDIWRGEKTPRHVPKDQA